MKNKIRLCFDLRPLQVGHENRGIGMHIKSILETLPESSDFEYLFYHFFNTNPIEVLDIQVPVDYTLLPAPLRKTSIKRVSDIADISHLVRNDFKSLEGKIDVFLQFDFTLGLPTDPAIKNVIIAYDLIPLLFSNQYLPSLGHTLSHSVGTKTKLRAAARSLYYRARYRYQYAAYKKADLVVSISDATRGDFIKILKTPEENITTIPLAPIALRSEKDPSLTPKDVPYLFYIGGTDDRKHIEDVVRAYNIIRGRGYELKLVLAGNELKEVTDIPSIATRNEIMKSPYKSDIDLVGFVSEEQRNSLYENARAYVFASAYEGFGLPVIEAMLAGCPVVCYGNSSIPESTGGHASLVKTRDVAALATATMAILDDKPTQQTIEAKKFATQQTWPKYTAQLLRSIGGLYDTKKQ